MLSLRIGNLNISVSFWFFAAIGFFLLYSHSVLFWYLMMPIVLHELGHLIAIYICGGSVSAVRFRAFGVDIEKGGGQMSYAKDIVITLAGAAVNLAAAGVLHAATTYPTMRSMLLVAVNLAAAAFSLLPVGNLDGGAIVRLIAERLGGVGFAYHASRFCSFLVLAPLFAVAFWLLIGPQQNFTLLVVCIYLAGVVCSGEGF